VLDTTVTGLTNGTSYTVQLRAVNADGPSAAGTADPATPVGVAGAPTILGQVTGNGSIQLSFGAPADNGGSAITYYQVSTDGGQNWNYALPYQDSPLTVNVSGLANGTAYQLQLRALNDQGNGAVATASSATPSTTPGAATNLTAVAGNGSARLSFSPPADNGGAYIRSYEYTVDGGDHWLTLNVDQLGLAKANKSKLTPTTYTATVTGLTNGSQYTFQVRAVNVNGGGAASDPVSVSPMAPPVAGVHLNGAATQVVAVGSTVTISGTAAAGSSVRIYFHQRGETGYLLRRTLTATSAGTFSTSYVAGDDYRYYAQVGTTMSDGVLTQVAPTVTGPSSQTVK
jgi:hypothetical protein